MKNLCYHTHNFFCDGKNSITEMVQSAIFQKVEAIGISSHAPIKNYNKWSISSDNIAKYRDEIAYLQQKYGKKIHIFTSLEIDYIPNWTESFLFYKNLIDLNYTIGAIHLVKHPQKNQLWFIDGNKQESQKSMIDIFDGDFKFAVTTYFKQLRAMITTQQPDIIAHMDKVAMNTIGVFFEEDEIWYQDEIQLTLETIKNHECILEINTRGIYKGKWHTSFPSVAIINKAFAMNIPITISTDAHSTSEILSEYNTAL